MRSPVQQAFLDQQKFTDAEADAYQQSIADAHADNERKAMLQLCRSQNVSDYMNVPTTIEAGSLDQTHEVHPKLKGYDHSLEKVRNQEAGIVKHVDGAEDADGISMGNLTSKDILGE